MTYESSRTEDVRMDLGALLGAVLSRWLRIIVLTLLLLAITYGILLFVPKMYESQAGVLVETRENAFTTPASGVVATSGTGLTVDAAISSEIELIKSRDTLLKVIDAVNLRSIPEFNGAAANPISLILQLFGRTQEVRSIDEMVLSNLNERLTVLRERDSAIISIFVRSRDPQLAADIANAMAAAHVQRRADLSLADTAEASVWLEQEIVKLRQRVTEAETAVANFRVDNDLFAGPNNTTLLQQQLGTLSGQITAAQERKNTAQSRAALIRGLLESGQPIEGVPDVRDSVVIQQLSQTKANLQGELAQREATLLPNHPTVRALAAQIDEIEQQLAIEARRVANALEAEAKIEADLEASLQDDLTRLKLSASSAATNNVTLDELEREAKAQRDLLESYLLRYRDAVARSDSSSAIPDVRVVTVAAPSVTPASPKVGLILGAVAFVSIALQIGGIIFGELMSGRALIERREEIYEDEVLDADAEEPLEEVYEEEFVLQEPAPPMPIVPPPVVPERELPTSVVVNVNSAPPSSAPEHQEPVDLQPVVASRPLRALELGNLVADLALGRVRVVMLASLGSQREAETVADRLVAEALRNGLSVVCVDAGSGRQSAETGITDLAADRASFGDVVHKGSREGLAEVPWGHLSALDRRSVKPLTLVEALTEIYEAVIVLTGRIGMASALPVFAGTDCRLVLVGEGSERQEAVDDALADAAALGFGQAQFVAAPVRHAEVA